MIRLLVSIVFFSCSVYAQAQHLEIKPADVKTPEAFGRTIVATCKYGSLGQWKSLLSKRFADLGDDFAMAQFEIWREAFKPVIDQYPNIKKIPVKLENDKLIKVANIPVIVEKVDGRYYINER